MVRIGTDDWVSRRDYWTRYAPTIAPSPTSAFAVHKGVGQAVPDVATPIKYDKETRKQSFYEVREDYGTWSVVQGDSWG